jgi:hypothetical protein
MFARFLKATAAAALALATVPFAAQAATVYVVQSSSPVYWSANGARADLVMRYNQNATVPLTINSASFIDLGTGVVAAQVQHCGTQLTPTSYQLAPGDFCWLDITRSTYEIVGRLLMSDATGAATNINQFVRASLVITDQGSNVLTHVELL